jgi:hypothetical protein
MQMARLLAGQTHAFLVLILTENWYENYLFFRLCGCFLHYRLQLIVLGRLTKPEGRFESQVDTMGLCPNLHLVGVPSS